MPLKCQTNLINMAIPPNASTALTDTNTDLTALQAAANTYFIDQSALVISQQIAEGKFVAYVTTFLDCDIKALVDYYTGLGYKVSFPDRFVLSGAQGNQPAELFGQSWEEFWEDGGIFPIPTNPVRMGISWAE